MIANIAIAICCAFLAGMQMERGDDWWMVGAFLSVACAAIAVVRTERK